MSQVAMRTVNFLSMEMPVIRDLGQGFVLAAHANGPVIVSKYGLVTLEWCGREPSVQEAELSLGESPGIDDEGLPFSIRHQAIKAYVDWSWPATAELRKSL